MRAYRYSTPVFLSNRNIVECGSYWVLLVACAFTLSCRSSRAPGEDGIGDNPANHSTQSRNSNSISISISISNNGYLSPDPAKSNLAKRSTRNAPVHAGPQKAELAPSVSLNLFYADMESLCRAINRDYSDGTLADTFSGLSPRSPQGASILRQASRAMYPGRILEHELARVKADYGSTTPPMPNCENLLDYIDDVE